MKFYFIYEILCILFLNFEAKSIIMKVMGISCGSLLKHQL